MCRGKHTIQRNFFLWSGNFSTKGIITEQRELRGSFSEDMVPVPASGTIWMGYQYAGNLKFEYSEECSFIKRELDIENAIAYAEREVHGQKRLLEAFCDCVHDVLVTQWYAESPVFRKTDLF